MRRLLFDTDVVSSWHGQLPEWSSTLDVALAEIEKRAGETHLFVSAVTFQELLFYAHTQRTAGDTERWLRETFTPLSFDAECARHAAEIQMNTGRPAKTSPKSADRAAVDAWVRDCAILGTATKHRIDLVVTADRGMYARREHFRRGMMWLREHGIYEWTGFVDPD